MSTCFVMACHFDYKNGACHGGIQRYSQSGHLLGATRHPPYGMHHFGPFRCTLSSSTIVSQLGEREHNLCRENKI